MSRQLCRLPIFHTNTYRRCIFGCNERAFAARSILSPKLPGDDQQPIGLSTRLEFGSLSDNCRSWSVENVCWWVGTLEGGRFQNYAHNFHTANVDGFTLLLLTEEELLKDLQVEVISHRKLIYNQILHLRSKQQAREKDAKLAKLEDLKRRLHTDNAASSSSIGPNKQERRTLSQFEPPEGLDHGSKRVQAEEPSATAINRKNPIERKSIQCPDKVLSDRLGASFVGKKHLRRIKEESGGCTIILKTNVFELKGTKSQVNMAHKLLQELIRPGAKVNLGTRVAVFKLRSENSRLLDQVGIISVIEGNTLLLHGTASQIEEGQKIISRILDDIEEVKLDKAFVELFYKHKARVMNSIEKEADCNGGTFRLEDGVIGVFGSHEDRTKLRAGIENRTAAVKEVNVGVDKMFAVIGRKGRRLDELLKKHSNVIFAKSVDEGSFYLTGDADEVQQFTNDLNRISSEVREMKVHPAKIDFLSKEFKQIEAVINGGDFRILKTGEILFYGSDEAFLAMERVVGEILSTIQLQHANGPQLALVAATRPKALEAIQATYNVVFSFDPLKGDVLIFGADGNDESAFTELKKLLAMEGPCLIRSTDGFKFIFEERGEKLRRDIEKSSKAEVILYEDYILATAKDLRHARKAMNLIGDLFKNIVKIECGKDIVFLFENDGGLKYELRRMTRVRFFVRGQDVFVGGAKFEFMEMAVRRIQNILRAGKSSANTPTELKKEISRLLTMPSTIRLQPLIQAIHTGRTLQREDELLSLWPHLTHALRPHFWKEMFKLNPVSPLPTNAVRRVLEALDKLGLQPTHKPTKAMFRHVFPYVSLPYVEEVTGIFEEHKFNFSIHVFKNFFQDCRNPKYGELCAASADPEVVGFLARLFVDKFVAAGANPLVICRHVAETLACAKVLNSRDLLKMLLAHMEQYPDLKGDFIAQLDAYNSSSSIGWDWSTVGGRITS